MEDRNSTPNNFLSPNDLKEYLQHSSKVNPSAVALDLDIDRKPDVSDQKLKNSEVMNESE